MKTNSSYSKICALLAIILFINPVIAAADALFSNLNLNDTALFAEELPTEMPCHEEHNTEMFDAQKMTHSDMAPDCCTDVCQCDDSGCHASSMVFQSKSPLVYDANQGHQYDLPLYLSLAFTPSSPPPII
tara:strand:+ start:11012 stop:11401 length:390 start_codon:yes stop_codon:yes gene_type:complete